MNLVERLARLLKEREWSDATDGGIPFGDRRCDTCDAFGKGGHEKDWKHKRGCAVALALREAGVESEME